MGLRIRLVTGVRAKVARNAAILGPTGGAMPSLTTQEVVRSQRPDRLLLSLPGLNPQQARRMAYEAQQMARLRAPKMSGAGAKTLFAVWGRDYIGLRFGARYMWYQEKGINPFTMKALAGKTIPMWINDPYGIERLNNPKAKTRVTESGTTQILIFRRAAKIGEMKTKKKRNKVTGAWETVATPKHFPGAPGRIGQRQATMTSSGGHGVVRSKGFIAKGNVGVWWRHPGLQPREFANSALTMVAQRYGYMPERMFATDSGWRP